MKKFFISEAWFCNESKNGSAAEAVTLLCKYKVGETTLNIDGPKMASNFLMRFSDKPSSRDKSGTVYCFTEPT